MMLPRVKAGNEKRKKSNNEKQKRNRKRLEIKGSIDIANISIIPFFLILSIFFPLGFLFF